MLAIDDIVERVRAMTSKITRCEAPIPSPCPRRGLGRGLTQRGPLLPECRNKCRGCAGAEPLSAR